jgi:polar amino acid transport system substrate-binding protein
MRQRARRIECASVNAATLCRSASVAVVSVVLACSLAACGGGDAAGTFTPRIPGTLSVATAEVPDPGFWLGTVRHPSGGFEYELARAMATHFGLAKVRVSVVPFADLVAGKLGGADLAISDITVTSARAEHVSFSSPYLDAPPAILVRPGLQVPDVNTAEGLRWAVQQGTTLQSALEQTIRPSSAPLLVHHQREALHALRSGRVDAVMLDLPVALAYARESPQTYSVAAQLPSEAVLAAALPKGSENLEAVDSALRALNADGTIERLGREWLHTDVSEDAIEQVPALRTEE